MRGRRLAILVFFAAAACRHSAFMSNAGNELDPAAPTPQKARLVFARPNPLRQDVVLAIADAKGERFLGESELHSRFAVLVDPGELLLVGWNADAKVEEEMSDPATESDLDAAIQAASVEAGERRSPAVSLVHLDVAPGKTYFIAVEPHGSMSARWLVPLRQGDDRWASAEEWSDSGPARKPDQEAGQRKYANTPRFAEACARARKAWERLDPKSKAALSVHPEDGR